MNMVEALSREIERVTIIKARYDMLPLTGVPFGADIVAEMEKISEISLGLATIIDDAHKAQGSGCVVECLRMHSALKQILPLPERS